MTDTIASDGLRKRAYRFDEEFRIKYQMAKGFTLPQRDHVAKPMPPRKASA